MRTLTLVGLLLLTTACEDRTVEVREAPAEDSSSATRQSPEGEPTDGDEAQGGLVVEVLERGEGPAVHTSSTLHLHYQAWLAEVHAEAGEPFDSSLARLVPLELDLSSSGPDVIEGLARGVLGLRSGAVALLRIPADLGYGETGHPAAGVPPDSDLVYEVRIVSVH